MIPDNETDAHDDTKRPPTRQERRAHERAFMAGGYRANKTRIAQGVANERGTLPDAREHFKIHQARQRLTAAARAEQARRAAQAAHPAGTATPASTLLEQSEAAA